MAKNGFSLERRKKEGKFLEEKFSLTKKLVHNISRAGLMREMNLSPAMWSQWVSGQTRISDQHLFYLSRRLGFDAIGLRPELAVYEVSPYIRADGELLDKMNKMSLLQRTMVYEIADIIAKLGV